ncbi:MAG: glycosyltransferase [Candidatus Falkowbacteria bacterium]|nr:glycosyltransferase [Candidatus Falkowbacteria bacterium]
MNIAVILPSYQEANNIAFVTKIIDKGLMAVQVKFPEIKKVVIANIDSSSPDKTSEIFRKVKTKNSKISFITKGKPGKGKNILFFLKKYQEQFDIFVMLDADLKSIKVDWIEKLISPIIRRKCDFVWPLYERSRFEGSTTNHFAYPIIYTLSGRDIRQPIAGDFAFSKKFVKKISHLSKPKGAYYYGIDIFLSLQAVLHFSQLTQIKLGKKIHKPSFSNLEILPQPASAVLDATRMKKLVLSSKVYSINFVSITKSQKFVHRKLAQKLLMEKFLYVSDNLDRFRWLEKELKTKLSVIVNSKKPINEIVWADILSSWLSYALSNRGKKHNSSKLSEELLPIFVIRAISFWEQVIGGNPLVIEKIIRRQAKLTRKKFIVKMKI